MFKSKIRRFVKNTLASDLWLPGFVIDLLLSVYIAVQEMYLVKIFYIGASMKLYWPEKGGYLGLHVTNFGDYQKKCITWLFNACEGLDVEITLKPHNYEGEAWECFLKSLKTKVKYNLKKWNDPINDTLVACDFVVMGHWGTSMIESALANKEVLLIDMFNSKPIAPYTNVTVTRNYDEFRHEILNKTRGWR